MKEEREKKRKNPSVPKIFRIKKHNSPEVSLCLHLNVLCVFFSTAFQVPENPFLQNMLMNAQSLLAAQSMRYMHKNMCLQKIRCFFPPSYYSTSRGFYTTGAGQTNSMEIGSVQNSSHRPRHKFATESKRQFPKKELDTGDSKEGEKNGLILQR